MSGKSIVALAVIGAIGAGLYFYKNRAREFPDVPLTSEREKTQTVAGIVQGKPAVLVMLLSGCPLSKYSADMVSGLAKEHSASAVFAGILMRGDRAAAAAYASQNSLSYPVYALDVEKDPFSMKPLMEAVGGSEGVYGGTVVIIDQDRMIKFHAAKEEVKKLKETLGSMGL
jgi:hypothetical protein